MSRISEYQGYFLTFLELPSIKKNITSLQDIAAAKEALVKLSLLLQMEIKSFPPVYYLRLKNIDISILELDDSRKNFADCEANKQSILLSIANMLGLDPEHVVKIE